jgi:hypothetical protein
MLSAQRADTPRKQRHVFKPTQRPFTPEQLMTLRAPQTRYQPEFAEKVIELMAEGYSLGGFAGTIGVGRRAINTWMEKHPDFDQACARGLAVRQYWWETKAIEIATTGGQGSQGQMVIFGLLNAGREDWRNRQEIEHTGEIKLSTVIETALRRIESRVIEGTATELPAGNSDQADNCF